jgi:hypothetical protein
MDPVIKGRKRPFLSTFMLSVTITPKKEINGSASADSLIGQLKGMCTQKGCHADKSAIAYRITQRPLFYFPYISIQQSVKRSGDGWIIRIQTAGQVLHFYLHYNISNTGFM